MHKHFFTAIAIYGILIAEECCPEKSFPQIQNCQNYNLFGIEEFLYWRFSSPNLIYGRTGVGVQGTTESAVKSGSTYLPDFDYAPGFRVGLGIKFGPFKAFDLIGIYTWLYSDQAGNVSGNPLPPTFLPTNFFNSGTAATNVYTFASLHLNLHLNVAEMQSGYTFLINRYFALRPYIALTAYIIDGDLRTKYAFTTPANAPIRPSTFEISKTHGTCNSWSIGPKTGLDVIYHITDHWGLFSNVNLSQQISRIAMKVVETEEAPADGVKFVIQKGNLTEDRNITLLGLEIGPTWDEWFCNEKYHLYIRATYQANNLNSGANLSFLNNNGIDIVMQSEYHGLNVRALFEF